MDTEIELKLLVPADASQILENRFFPSLAAQVERSSFNLFNCYYDTPDSDFRKMDMGLRVRGYDGHYEQTIKTAGSTLGGLHQRPEYNVDIEGNNPDLTLFEQAIWPEQANVEQLQQAIQIVFTTHFERVAYQVDFTNGDRVEIVFDQGKIEADGHSVPICEMELELKQGETTRLVELAQLLSEMLPFRLGIQSKAARGYMLAKGVELSPLEPSGCVQLVEQDNIEQAFIKAVGYVLNWWQYHEQCYLNTEDEQALDATLNSVRMLAQLLRIYQPVFNVAEIDELLADLQKLIQQWAWVQELNVFRMLRSERGAFRKKLDKSAELLSYLEGRSQGLLMTHQPQKLISSKITISLQLRLNLLLLQMPWRNVGDGWQGAITDFARQTLSASLQQVSDIMASEGAFTIEQYQQAEPRLRNVLFNGVFLADIFSASGREQFRAPWLDILDGIEELVIINSLQAEVRRSDIEHKQDLLDWSEEKIQRVLDVMEQSRQAALTMQPYWQ
ncbi:CYTH domain-containing protein [Neptunicella sp. SCSIO 80796]|uniref:CYTH and CHAD domain-containing protein n=1 Tax=Neptunicella plasticusilytica TaxID=3117012 RepID=UPI003A4E242E